MRESSDRKPTLTLHYDELVTVNHALNEVLHGLDPREFSTRMAAGREEAQILLDRVSACLDGSSPAGTPRTHERASEGARPEIREVLSDEETAATFPVMRQLRPHIAQNEYTATVGRMRGEGYRLVAAYDEAGRVVGIAGFRIQEMLAHGRFLYVDDLVTDENSRSGGVGAAMLRWLEDVARNEGCTHLHLDSGVQRAGAHRFYFREGMEIAYYHFKKEL